MLLATAGCSRAAKVVHQDLVERASSAERRFPYELLLFGTPVAEPYEKAGFVRERGRAAGDRHMWAEREARLALSWPKRAARFLVLDMAPSPGVASQSVEVSVNGKALQRITLASQRRRYGVPIPSDAQERRQNEIELVFAETAPLGGPHGRPLAAALYAAAVGLAEDEPLRALLEPGAPPPLTVDTTGERHRLVQAAGSSLRYAFRVPEGAELRFSPRLHPMAAAARASLLFRITLRKEGGEAEEIWSRLVPGQGESTSEVSVLLPAPADSLVELTLYVSGATPTDGATWGIWEAPRVLGRPPLDPLRADAPIVAADADVRRLEGRLARASAILIVLDAAGARHFGCYGYPRQTTPEIDRIASEGVVFERAYTTANFTRAAMGSVWTSRFPGSVTQRSKLPAAHRTLAELLAARGIHTAGFVANAKAGRAYDLHRGFAEFEEVLEGDPPSAAAFRRVLPAWFAANKERRFLAYIHFREPHAPYNPPPPFDTRFGPNAPLPPAARLVENYFDDVNAGLQSLTAEQLDHLVRLYDGNLAFADHEIGALRKTLEDLGLWDRTVIIITGDHGEALYEHGYIGHNYQLYEDSVRIPLIVRFPRGKGPSGARASGLVSSLDIAPTLAGIFGLADAEDAARQFEGMSLLSVALGRPGRASVLSRSTGKESFSLRDGRCKYIFSTRSGEDEFYELTRDPREQDNLVGRRPVRRTYYRQLLFEKILALERSPLDEDAEASLSPEQRENLRALGYVE
jgi:arylsulfatase A-like enzyme